MFEKNAFSFRIPIFKIPACHCYVISMYVLQNIILPVSNRHFRCKIVLPSCCFIFADFLPVNIVLDQACVKNTSQKNICWDRNDDYVFLGLREYSSQQIYCVLYHHFFQSKLVETLLCLLLTLFFLNASADQLKSLSCVLDLCYLS